MSNLEAGFQPWPVQTRAWRLTTLRRDSGGRRGKCCLRDISDCGKDVRNYVQVVNLLTWMKYKYKRVTIFLKRVGWGSKVIPKSIFSCWFVQSTIYLKPFLSLGFNIGSFMHSYFEGSVKTWCRMITNVRGVSVCQLQQEVPVRRQFLPHRPQMPSDFSSHILSSPSSGCPPLNNASPALVNACSLISPFLDFMLSISPLL